MGREVPTAELFEQMARMRAFEDALAGLWADGLISGELHLGIGEEGIFAGVLDHLSEGDALALDHRPTPALVGWGTDLEALALEMVGSPNGLCAGQGGHMHLFDRERCAASSGIVGASGPLACGFAMARQTRNDGRIAVAFFGESAINQGMLMESFNLAAVWRLPVLFVVKDNGWAITTRSNEMRATSIGARVRGFGLGYRKVDGSDVAQTWRAAERMVDRARRGKPGVLHATCHRPHGHFEDDPLVSMVRHPLRSRRDMAGLVSAVRDGDGAGGGRLAGMMQIGRTFGSAALEFRSARHDPLRKAAGSLPGDFVSEVWSRANTETAAAVESARSAWEHDHA